jgi:hypothetical protein
MSHILNGGYSHILTKSRPISTTSWLGQVFIEADKAAEAPATWLGFIIVAEHGSGG